MSKFKRLTIGLSIVATMVVAFVCGLIGLNISKHQHAVSNVDNVEQEVEKIKPSEITYKASDISIQTGGDNLDYSYVPSVNSGEDASTVIAYEYIFGNPNDETAGINLNTIETYDDVTISFAYVNERLNLDEDVTTYTKFATQTIATDAYKYVYIFISPVDTEVPTTFSTSLYWNYGKAGELTIKSTANGAETKTTIIKGQTLTMDMLDIPACDYNLMGIYKDEGLTKEVSETIIAGTTTLYAQYPNLPTSYLSYYYSNQTYKIQNNSAELPKNLILPATYKGKSVTTITSSSSSNSPFKDKGIESVFIPNTITNMGTYTFYSCAELTSIKFQDNSQLTSIQAHSFQSCGSLQSITIPDSVISIGASAFSGCRALTDITLPEGITTIGEETFSHCTALTIITIPASVTTIVDAARSKTSPFYGCTSLKDVIFAEGSQLKTIGRYVFYNCSALTNINIPEGVASIENYTFYGCSALTSITIPASVTTITNANIYTGYSSAPFYGCTSLKEVIFAEGSQLKTIGDYVFYQCRALQSVTIPSTVTTIGSGAFYQCSALQSVTIPSTVTSIGGGAFTYCYDLAEVYNLSGLSITAGGTNYGNVATYASVVVKGSSRDTSKLATIDGVDYYKQDNTDSNYMAIRLSDKSVSEIVLDDRTTSIGRYAFYGCNGVNSVTIPEGVTSIGNYAFYNCDLLQNIIIPASVTSINTYAFSSCSALISVDFGKDSQLATIGASAFYYCSALQSITIPSNVTKIDSYAFNGCYDLAEVYNLSSLSITSGSGSNGNVAAFASVVQKNERDASKRVTIDGVDYYKNSDNDYIAIRSRNDLTSVNLDSRTTKIGNYAFYNTDGLTSVTIPSAVTSIGSCAFYDCDAITSVNFEDDSKLTSIGTSAFYDCDAITSVNFEDDSKLTSIGTYAFQSCSSLVSVDFGANSVLKTIGSSAFESCGKLQSITIPASVTKIDLYAFKYCYDLAEVYNLSNLDLTLDPNKDEGYITSYYSSIVETTPRDTSKLLTIDGVDYYVDGDDFVAIRSRDDLTSVTLDNRTTAIGKYAFYNCKTLTGITMPSSVTSIGNYAFYNTGLTSVAIPDRVTSIGNSSFYGCTALASVTFDENSQLISMGSYAFYGCSKLTNISIPASVTSIGERAFYLCSALTSITIPVGVTSISPYAFYGCSVLAEVIFAQGIQLTSIGYQAFYNCKALTSINIPEGVTSIETQAFYGCSVLAEVIFAQGIQLTSIGNQVFYGCSVLTGVVLPSTLIDLGYNAFAGCTALVYNELNDGYYLGSSTNPYFALVQTSANNITSITVHEDTQVIGGNAFYNHTSLTEVDLSACTNLKGISFRAFYGCKVLPSITIPNTVTFLGQFLFQGCSVLATIEFEDNSQLTTIGAFAFYECTGVTSITIPSSVTSIGERAFYLCSALTSITIPARVNSIGSYVFYNCSALTSITFETNEGEDLTNLWYRTTSSTDWKNKQNGTKTNLSTPTNNDNYFKSSYYQYYWYKK